LYKAGEADIFVSGWVRKSGKSKAPKGILSVELYDPSGNVVSSRETKELDGFGGFKTNFPLSKDAKL
jgi:hypothetical protein